MPEVSKLTLKTENVRLNGKPDTVYINLPPGDYIRLTIADTGRGIFISEAISYLANWNNTWRLRGHAIFSQDFDRR